MARTGEIFGFKHYGITPDIMCLAKALGGGLPSGAMIVKKEFSGVFKPGMHGSTFAGSPLVCKAALGVIKVIYAEKIMKNVKIQGPYLVGRLEELKSKYDIIKEVRGLGLMIGVELTIDGAAIVKECFNRGLIINCTQGNVLRIMPALNVTRRQINKAVYILDGAIECVNMSNSTAGALSRKRASASFSDVLGRVWIALALLLAAAGYSYDLSQQRDLTALQLPLTRVGQRALALSTAYAILLIIGLCAG